MGNCSCVTHDSKKQFLCDNFMRGLRFINLIMFSQSQSRILVLQIKLVECKGGRTSWVCSYTVLQLSGSRIMTFIKNHGQKEKRKPPDETTAHCIHFLVCKMAISCYEGMENQSHQAPVGMTATSTPVNREGFIMMHVANIERMSPLLIDFQLCSP